MTNRPWGVRLFAKLLWFFPRRFRSRYGPEMLDFLAEAWEASSGRGRVKLMVRATADAVVNGMSERAAGGGAARNGWWMMGGIGRDVRFALRSLTRRPGFAAVVVLTIALGTGAAGAMFAVVDAVVLRPLPYVDRDRLVAMWTTFEGQGDFGLSLAEHHDYAAESRALDALGSYTLGSATLTGFGDARPVSVARTWGDLFDVIGARVSMGRLPGPTDVRTAAAAVAVVSHDFWTSALGSDPAAVGRTLDLDQQSVEIVGVLEPDVRLPTADPAIWRPIAIDRADIQNRSGHGLEGIGRLAPGQSLATLRSEIDATHVRWHEVWAGAHSPGHEGHALAASGLHERYFGSFRATGTLILASIALLLLITCANVASLLLARGEGHAADLALRRALGAGRARIVRQLLVESLTLALIGGAIGLALAVFGIEALLRLEPGTLPRVDTIGLDRRMTTFSVLATLASGMAFGVLPAVRAGSVSMRGARGSTGPDRGLSRSLAVLVVSQVGLAIVLLAGAALLVRSVSALAEAETGIETERRLTFELSLPSGGYRDDATINGLWNRLTADVEALPGVEEAAVVRLLPLRDGVRREGMRVAGREIEPGDAGDIAFGAVTPGYFSVMGVPIVEGRDFRISDEARSARVGLVNEAAARAYWPGESPLGRRVFPLFMPDSAVTIVGVVGDVHAEGVRAGVTPELYLAYAQLGPNLDYIRAGAVVARTSVDPTTLLAAVRDVVERIDPELAVTSLSTLDEVAADARARERFLATMLGVFAAIALLLTAMGTYGVVAYAVAQRAREFGVRIALGAPRAAVLGSVVRGGMTLAGLGAVLGIGGALALGPVLEGLVFGVATTDRVALALGPLVMAAVVLLASTVPALRASRVDPLESLRAEV